MDYQNTLQNYYEQIAEALKFRGRIKMQSLAVAECLTTELRLLLELAGYTTQEADTELAQIKKSAYQMAKNQTQTN